MSNNIVLKRGLDIPISGTAAQKTTRTIKSGTIALKPSDFKGLLPRLLVREGDSVKAGSPVLADKKHTDIMVTSPVSGTVAAVVRGEKRKLLEVRIKADDKQEYEDFGIHDAASLNAEEVKSLLLRSGLWASLVQRPYGIIADPDLRPKAIFVSAFSTAPLAPDTEYVLGDQFAAVQAGATALGKLTDGGVHVSLNAKTASATAFHKLEGVILHTFEGSHPAGNVGVQISHISPIMKGDTVWTVSLLMLAAIGKMLTTGKVDLSRKVAVTGPVAKAPAYIETVPGVSMREISEFYDNSNADVRFVSGDPLTGKDVGLDGSLGYFDNQITLLHEGTEREVFGWLKPIRPKVHSASHTALNFLNPKKLYDMDTNLHGGKRTFIVSDVYSNVLPMDLYPVYLFKACLAKDIDKMEQYGIYEVLPEDLATCEYVDPSKNDIQDIISSGIDVMLKEMA